MALVGVWELFFDGRSRGRRTIIEETAVNPKSVERKSVGKQEEKLGEKGEGGGMAGADNTIDDTTQTATKGKLGPSFYGTERSSGLSASVHRVRACTVYSSAVSTVWHLDRYS